MKDDARQRGTCLPHLSTTETSQFDIFCSFSANKTSKKIKKKNSSGLIKRVGIVGGF